MDATFHIAVKEVEAAAKVCEAERSAEDILAALSLLSASALKALAPLLRGSQSVDRKEDLLKAVKEYPFIAFVLVQNTLEAAIKKAREHLTEQAALVAHMESLQLKPAE